MGTTTTTVRGLRVAELAGAAGVSPDTVRYYERVGLLPSPPHDLLQPTSLVLREPPGRTGYAITTSPSRIPCDRE